MKKEIKTLYVDNFNQTKTVEFEPIKLCPYCKVSTNNDDRLAFYVPINSDRYKMYIVCFCSHCESIYLTEYVVRDPGYGYTATETYYIATYPYPNESKDFSENIQAISPNFIKIYNQSLKSENMGLSEICGMGYRKALEFLIKDYAIALNNDDEQKIITMPLSQVIDKFIDNQRIKSLSKASAWIGNDETHYQRKHADYNVNHLKSFIHATVAFIDSDLEVYNAEKLLSK